MDGYFDLDKGVFIPGESGSFSGAAKSLLVLTEKEKILIDTGIGDLPDLPKYRELRKTISIHRDKGQGIKAQLRKHGLKPSDITSVVNTHLHTAHSGNNSLFTKAKFYVTSRECKAVDDLTSKDPNQMSYVRENFEREKDQILVKGNYKLTDEVTLVPTPGHTMGHQSIVIDCENYKLVYCGDVSPLKENLDRKIPMASVNSKMTLESMEKLLEIPNSRWIFSHDPKQLSMRSAFHMN